MKSSIKRLLWCVCIGLGFGSFGAQIGTAQWFSLPGYLPYDSYPSFWSPPPPCSSCYIVNRIPQSCDGCEVRGCNSVPNSNCSGTSSDNLDCVKNPNDPRCLGACVKCGPSGCAPGYGAPTYEPLKPVPQVQPESRRVNPRSTLTKNAKRMDLAGMTVVRKRQHAPERDGAVAKRYPENDGWMPVAETKTASR